MHATLPLLENNDFPSISRMPLESLQVNLGYLCNLSCVHCHVNAGPQRKELMSEKTINDILAFIDKAQITTLDLTGGAPEMNPYFKFLVSSARSKNIRVIDRCNLVILEEEGYHDLAGFLAAQQVEITASLPCYLEDNVDKQRGQGVFDTSISALQRLNRLGYGNADSELVLNLVFNPQGPELPPPQQNLEKAYKSHLKDNFGIFFNQLYTITNMPIQRFGSTLISKGQFNSYLQLLRDNHQADNLAEVMCRNTLSIDWQGYVYDCDFNQMLQLPLGANREHKIHINEINHQQINGRSIAVRQHCYGCTAGQGSSCGGAFDAS